MHLLFILAPDTHASAVDGLRLILGISTSAYSFSLAYTHTPVSQAATHGSFGQPSPGPGQLLFYSCRNTFFYRYTYRI